MTSKQLTNYIIFDIDGVFNPYLATNLLERGFIRYVKEWIHWDLDIVNHAQWVRELEDYADIVWGSNWNEESNALAGWFHMKNLSYPHIPITKGASMSTTWKLPDVSMWIDENVGPYQKVVWVEDEVYEDVTGWLNSHPNVLLVKTDARVGLTFEHFETIKAFLA